MKFVLSHNPMPNGVSLLPAVIVGRRPLRTSSLHFTPIPSDRRCNFRSTYVPETVNMQKDDGNGHSGGTTVLLPSFVKRQRSKQPDNRPHELFRRIRAHARPREVIGVLSASKITLPESGITQKSIRRLPVNSAIYKRISVLRPEGNDAWVLSV